MPKFTCTGLRQYDVKIQCIHQEKCKDPVTEDSVPMYLTGKNATSFRVLIYFFPQTLFLELARYHYSLKDINMKYDSVTGFIMMYWLAEQDEEDVLVSQAMALDLPADRSANSAILEVCPSENRYTFDRRSGRAVQFHSFVVDYASGSVETLGDSSLHYYEESQHRPLLPQFRGKTEKMVLAYAPMYTYFTRKYGRFVFIHKHNFSSMVDRYEHIKATEVKAMATTHEGGSLYLCTPRLIVRRFKQTSHNIGKVLCQGVTVRGGIVAALTMDTQIQVFNASRRESIGELDVPQILLEMNSSKIILK